MNLILKFYGIFDLAENGRYYIFMCLYDRRIFLHTWPQLYRLIGTPHVQTIPPPFPPADGGGHTYLLFHCWCPEAVPSYCRLTAFTRDILTRPLPGGRTDPIADPR